MTSKVFLYGPGARGLYCSNVRYKDGVWYGYVINGSWKMIFDTKTNTMSTGKGNHSAELVWVGDAIKGHYNDVIADAKERYKTGEPSNFKIIEDEKENLNEDIPY